MDFHELFWAEQE